MKEEQLSDPSKTSAQLTCAKTALIVLLTATVINISTLVTSTYAQEIKNTPAITENKAYSEQRLDSEYDSNTIAMKIINNAIENTLRIIDIAVEKAKQDILMQQDHNKVNETPNTPSTLMLTEPSAETSADEPDMEYQDENTIYTSDIPNNELAITVAEETYEETEKYEETDITVSEEPIEEPIVQEEPQEETPTLNIQYGDSGAFIIPSLGYSVPLYWVSNPDYDIETTQYITDLENSAAFFNYHDWHTFTNGSVLMIADHGDQGFKVLFDVYEGDTAYINDTPYTCIFKNPHGTNTNTGGDGIITGASADIVARTKLITYCCNPGGWEDITICLWG